MRSRILSRIILRSPLLSTGKSTKSALTGKYLFCVRKAVALWVDTVVLSTDLSGKKESDES